MLMLLHISPCLELVTFNFSEMLGKVRFGYIDRTRGFAFTYYNETDTDLTVFPGKRLFASMPKMCTRLHCFLKWLVVKNVREQKQQKRQLCNTHLV